MHRTCSDKLCIYLGRFRGPAYRPSYLLDTAANSSQQMQYTNIEVSRYFRVECLNILYKKITFHNSVLFRAELFHSLWIARHCDFIAEVPGSNHSTTAVQSGFASTTPPPPLAHMNRFNLKPRPIQCLLVCKDWTSLFVDVHNWSASVSCVYDFIV